MTFKLKCALGRVGMSSGEWKITFSAPASEATEVAKICLTCQDQLLDLTIDNEQPEVIGERA